MSLMIGHGPFAPDSAGRFNFEPPERVVYIERFPRRVRAVRSGQTVIDSDEVQLVHESGSLPRYLFPAKHVQVEAEWYPDVEGHVVVAWEAVDAWFEEDERVLVHPRDPYHRIDTFSTSRRVEVRLEGVVLAASTRVKALYETALPVRYYFPRADVRLDRLTLSDTLTECAYKGAARHWSAVVHDHTVPDVAWSYDDEVRPEGEPIRGRIAFYNERVDLDVDGARLERPPTAWSR
ncbi:MAG: DUF427 domain-containing protein [Actinomycetota bacterium]|nr:DUF427 domain-containing protein [Actinomycetota bacterium]